MKGMNNISSINQKWVREPTPDPLWLKMVSHEATHINHFKQAGGKHSYLVHFLKQYIMYGGHDNVPEEKEADRNRNKFQRFNNFVEKNYGKNCLKSLLSSDVSDGQKIRQIDVMFKEWKAIEKENNI